ncbi:response regulator [Rubritalea marina]|uniref:response regulator n=1 Tax=Rubritalea marina TaxID=361055 RepID=UPI00036520B8|nr:response regulator [Rubritalea marina]
MFATLNLDYYTDINAENYEVEALLNSMEHSKNTLHELSKSRALNTEELANQQIEKVILNTEDFMHSVERLRLSNTKPIDLEFNSKFYPLYVEVSEAILANNSLGDPIQRQLSDASYQLAYGHLLIAETANEGSTETFNEILSSFTSAKVLVTRIEKEIVGGESIINGLQSLTQMVEKKYQNLVDYQNTREQAYNNFTNSYAAFHINTLAVESYLDTFLKDHEASLLSYVSRASSMTTTLLISSIALGLGICVLFYKTVLTPFIALMDDTQMYLESGEARPTPGLNRKDEVGTFAKVVDDLKKSDIEKSNVMQELGEATRVAQQANQAKSQFLANMSHEIRTPLNSIIGFTNIMHEEELNREQRNMVGSIKSSSRTLLALVNDILDLAKIESNELTIESIPVNLEDLVYEVVETQVSSTTKKSVELNIDSQDVFPQLCTDPTRLKQVIMNLVSNASKFTEEGEILISMKSAYEDDITQTVEFSVNDTGIGMTKEQAASIFDAFKQADGTTTRKFGGTGLGLNISKKLIEAFGGEIHVESAPMKGSCFSFQLKFKKNYSAKKSSELALDITSLKSKKFLIVDDNASARMIMSRYFKDEDLEHYVASDVDEAITLLKQHDIEVVLTDLMMPGKDGFDLYEEAALLDNDYQFIAVTSDLRSSTISKIKELGFSGYLFKPIRKISLKKSLLEILNADLETQSAEEDTETEENVSMHILLVDDNNTNILVGKMILSRMGHTVTTALSGQTAIDLVESTNFDLVLMDMQMPNMSGIEATVKIRDLGHRLPIIALTANAFESDKQSCIDAGMNDYMTKPIDKERLQETIANYASKNSKQMSS